MLVRSRTKELTNVEVYIDKIFYRFANNVCEMPDTVALNFVQANPDYEIVKESVTNQKTGNFLPFNPSTWNKKKKKIMWDGPIGYNNGYGNGSMMFIEGLNNLGDVDVYAVNNKWAGSDLNHMPKTLQKLMKKETDEVDSFYVKFFPAMFFGDAVAERFVGYTMLEATRIPKSWVDVINRECERVVVPSTQQKQAFIDSGVVRDIAVVPLGLDFRKYPYLDRSDHAKDDFIFGTMGNLTYRKGTDILVKAFLQAFPKNKYPDVRLYIKTLAASIGMNLWFMSRKTLQEDPRIVLVGESWGPQEMLDEFFGKIDAFAFPTRGEGFGLPPLEAMATGLPVICTKFSGCEEFMDESVSYPLDYKLVPVPNGTAGGYPVDLQAEGQEWAEPDLDQLIELMRYVYENRDKAMKKGEKAAAFARKNFSNEVVARRLVDYLDSKF